MGILSDRWYTWARTYAHAFAHAHLHTNTDAAHTHKHDPHDEHGERRVLGTRGKVRRSRTQPHTTA